MTLTLLQQLVGLEYDDIEPAARGFMADRLGKMRLLFSVKRKSRNSPHRLPGKRHGKFPAFAIRLFPMDYGNGDCFLLPNIAVSSPQHWVIQVAVAA